jgi:uncharacterized protein (TIGR00288 family)
VEEQQKIAVFIDYDNIEIGVKTTLHREFSVRIVLDGLKERGEVVSKTAYGDWSRHGNSARAFSEQGVQMVQRDTTPMGDKNGGDINLALDALEMAFTREHINAFAIISGDSDFMPLVNKLKQSNKRVYIVGGKAFTSTILQRNCHEFVSYESLLDSEAPRSRRGGGSGQRSRPRRSLPLNRAMPLIDRALHSLDMRSVQPQLGLLKSTMQQLDSAFSERDYGASSFSGFIEKLVKEGHLSVRTVDGQKMVERSGDDEEAANGGTQDQEDAIRMLSEVLEANTDILAMGIPEREVEAVVSAADPDFKQTDYGFSEFAELLNYARDKGLVRVEADLDHGLRYYPGDELLNPSSATETEDASAAPSADTGDVADAEPNTPDDAPKKRAPARPSSRGRGRRTPRSRSTAPRKAAAPKAAAPEAAAPPKRVASTRRPAGAPVDADD